MASELLSVLLRRRQAVDANNSTFESKPEQSAADASHLTGLKFGGAPDVQEWLRRREIPEEDRVAELLAQHVTERGARPEHTPELPPDEESIPEEKDTSESISEELLRMARDVEEAREKLEEFKAQISNKEVELSGQETKLKSKEDSLRAREKALTARETAHTFASVRPARYQPPRWLKVGKGSLNVGVVGESGVGKSLLINTLRRVEPGDAGWAKVGVSETTFEPKAYPFRNENRVKLWDLPGAGTTAFPREEYVATMGLRFFDSVLVVSAGRFTETEVLLARELRDHQVPHFMVRTKLDQDVENNRKDNGAEEEETVLEIRRDLQSRGVQQPYLVSSREPEKFDMSLLLRDIFPRLESLLKAGAGFWDENWALPEASHSELVACACRVASCQRTLGSSTSAPCTECAHAEAIASSPRPPFHRPVRSMHFVAAPGASSSAACGDGGLPYSPAARGAHLVTPGASGSVACGDGDTGGRKRRPIRPASSKRGQEQSAVARSVQQLAQEQRAVTRSVQQLAQEQRSMAQSVHHLLRAFVPSDGHPGRYSLDVGQAIDVALHAMHQPHSAPESPVWDALPPRDFFSVDDIQFPSSIRRPWDIMEVDARDQLSDARDADLSPVMDQQKHLFMKLGAKIRKNGALATYHDLAPHERRIYLDVARQEAAAFLCWRRQLLGSLSSMWDQLDVDSKGGYVPEDLDSVLPVGSPLLERFLSSPS